MCVTTRVPTTLTPTANWRYLDSQTIDWAKFQSEFNDLVGQDSEHIPMYITVISMSLPKDNGFEE
jgi:hypothetical protein